MCYNFSSSDLEDATLYYMIDWGDGNISDWIVTFKCKPLNINHIWKTESSYTIRAKAKDLIGLESDWGILEVSMPKKRDFNIMESIISRLIERFSFLQPYFYFIF